MNRPLRSFRLTALCGIAALLLSGFTGCVQAPTPPPKPVNESVPDQKVPPFMVGTIIQRTMLQNDQPFLISGWGLVVHLNGTGGSHDVPNNVKAYMSKEMEKKGFGSQLNSEYKDISPEIVLNDRNAAIVAVYGWIPPGARSGQFFDLAVKAEGLEVTSLARGLLYDTELTIDGANASEPSRRVNVFATAYGPVFVNPAVALQASASPDAATKRTLRSGTIIGGGQIIENRPLLLRLRQPEKRLARAIERRVNEAFHQDKVCTAYNEAYCQLWVPEQYQGDWEHFAKLVQHMFMQGGSDGFARAKARELVGEARKPGAPLQDISYCWEGLGSVALPELAPLLADATTPTDVRFAAARAAAYIGDPSGAALRSLYDIAAAPRNPFQLSAVEVLGHVPSSRAIDHLLRDLLDSEETTIRIEAYNILARDHDTSIQSRVIASAREPTNQKFVLDYVSSRGAPLVYATRSGVPRIAIFGAVPELALPLTFNALDNRLMISSGAVGRDVTIFYRDAQLPRPIQMSCPPDIADVLARLGGQMDDGTGQLDFTYAEVLGILQGLSDGKQLRVMQPTGEEVAAAFRLQDVPGIRDAIDNAPLLDRGRPQGENASKLDAPPDRTGQAPEHNAVNSAVTLEHQ